MTNREDIFNYYQTLCVKQSTHMFRNCLRQFNIKPSKGVKVIIQDLDCNSFGGYVNGNPYVRLNIKRFVDNSKVDHHELKSFSASADIGSLINEESEIALLALIAHQSAHAVQFYLKFMRENHVQSIAKSGIDLIELNKMHGKEWKRFYRFLRETYVNNRRTSNG